MYSAYALYPHTHRVERVGWGQTKIRGRDTRSTFVPNSHFVQAAGISLSHPLNRYMSILNSPIASAVTNMDRITHRKFDAIVPLRYQVHKSSFAHSIRLVP